MFGNIYHLGKDQVIIKKYDSAGNEITTGWPLVLDSISEEDDLILFEFTSNWTVSTAKYIIGIAAAMSGDLNYAESLFNDLLNSIKTQDHNFPSKQS